MTTRTLGATTTRRAFALGLGALLAGRLAPSAGAAPRRNLPSIKNRVADQVQNCQDLGGSASVTVRPGGTSVACSGGGFDGLTCVNSSKKTRCYASRVAPDAGPADGATAGGNAGIDG